MPESILEKKSRLLGNIPENSSVVPPAVRSREWTAQDAVALRRAQDGSKRSNHSERVAGTMRGNLRTAH